MSKAAAAVLVQQALAMVSGAYALLDAEDKYFDDDIYNLDLDDALGRLRVVKSDLGRVLERLATQSRGTP